MSNRGPDMSIFRFVDDIGGGNTVIGMIEKMLGKKAVIENKEFHIADIKETWANISKAERLLGWKPEISFEEGIKRSVEWHNKFKHLGFKLTDS